MPKQSKKEREEFDSRIKSFIIEYFMQHGYAPSYKEIALSLQSSTATILHHIKKMIEEGTLETDAKDGSPRAIRVPELKMYIKETENKL